MDDRWGPASAGCCLARGRASRSQPPQHGCQDPVRGLLCLPLWLSVPRSHPECDRSSRLECASKHRLPKRPRHVRQPRGRDCRATMRPTPRGLLQGVSKASWRISAAGALHAVILGQSDLSREPVPEGSQPRFERASELLTPRGGRDNPRWLAASNPSGRHAEEASSRPVPEGSGRENPPRIARPNRGWQVCRRPLLRLSRRKDSQRRNRHDGRARDRISSDIHSENGRSMSLRNVTHTRVRQRCQFR